MYTPPTLTVWLSEQTVSWLLVFPLTQDICVSILRYRTRGHRGETSTPSLFSFFFFFFNNLTSRSKETNLSTLQICSVILILRTKTHGQYSM